MKYYILVYALLTSALSMENALLFSRKRDNLFFVDHYSFWILLQSTITDIGKPCFLMFYTIRCWQGQEKALVIGERTTSYLSQGNWLLRFSCLICKTVVILCALTTA